jgi:hypothetical protein
MNDTSGWSESCAKLQAAQVNRHLHVWQFTAAFLLFFPLISFRLPHYRVQKLSIDSGIRRMHPWNCDVNELFGIRKIGVELMNMSSMFFPSTGEVFAMYFGRARWWK